MIATAITAGAGKMMKDIECEIIVLNEAWEMIDTLVSHSLLRGFEKTGTTWLHFNSLDAQFLFYIFLADFFSDINAKRDPPPLGLPNLKSKNATEGSSILHYLRYVAEHPVLLRNKEKFLKTVSDLEEWRDGTIEMEKINFADVGVEVSIPLSRYDCVLLCGNTSKHSPIRLSRCAKHLRDLIKRTGNEISEPQAYLAVKNFSEWFSDYSHIYDYHLNQVSELLNKIRFAIYFGLGKEYARAYRRIPDILPDLPSYEYDVPKDIESQIVRSMYWDLMNKIRSRPCVPIFTINDFHRNKY